VTLPPLPVDVAALYCDPRGPYPHIPGVETWGLPARDARSYNGPYPVVAHPPCGSWSRVRHLYKGNDGDCAVRALEQVRLFGDICEHPAESKLWEHDPDLRSHLGRFHIGGRYGFSTDRHGGFCLRIDQVEWGHVARKPTWLYLVRVPQEYLRAPPFPERKPTHWLSGGRTKSSRQGSPVPPGIKVCSAQQRRRTPVALAEYLVSLARASVPS
jgi:hypothetical protein